jgi:hypothetical protein
MKQENDIFTKELPLNQKTRGRTKIYASTAERVAAYRARQNKCTLTTQIDKKLMQRLDQYLYEGKDGKKDMTKSQVIEKALANFFRKR